MEVEKLTYALQETISCLRSSKSPGPSQMPVEEIIRRLEAEISKARNATPKDMILFDRLFAPTGAIRAISVANGWGTKFLRISEVIDQFTVR
jgi:hypothetical protein